MVLPLIIGVGAEAGDLDPVWTVGDLVVGNDDGPETADVDGRAAVIVARLAATASDAVARG